jgi:hypothetical protein
MKGYRLVEVKNGKIMSLYHGTNGTRVITPGKTMTAYKTVAEEGTGGQKFISGFHFFPFESVAKKYMTRFKRTDRTLAVVPGFFTVNLRYKYTFYRGPGTICLSDKMRITKKDAAMAVFGVSNGKQTRTKT